MNHLSKQILNWYDADIVYYYTDCLMKFISISKDDRQPALKLASLKSTGKWE